MAEKLTATAPADAYASEGYAITEEIQEALDALELLEDGEDYDVPMEEEDLTNTALD